LLRTYFYETLQNSYQLHLTSELYWVDSKNVQIADESMFNFRKQQDANKAYRLTPTISSMDTGGSLSGVKKAGRDSDDLHPVLRLIQGA
jgi:hypothetical protein